MLKQQLRRALNPLQWMLNTLLPQDFDAVGPYEVHMQEGDQCVAYVGQWWNLCSYHIVIAKRDRVAS